MDPVTAFLNLSTATLNLVTAAFEGASPAQKQVFLQWYIDDMNRWRKLLKLDAA